MDAAVGDAGGRAADRADREQRSTEWDQAGTRGKSGIADLEHAEGEGERAAGRIDDEEPAVVERTEQMSLLIRRAFPVT